MCVFVSCVTRVPVSSGSVCQGEGEERDEKITDERKGRRKREEMKKEKRVARAGKWKICKNHTQCWLLLILPSVLVVIPAANFLTACRGHVFGCLDGHRRVLLPFFLPSKHLPTRLLTLAASNKHPSPVLSRAVPNGHHPYHTRRCGMGSAPD